MTYAFNMSLGTLKPRPSFVRFAIFHNGVAIPGAEHPSKRDALVAAWQLSKTCGTAIENFRVAEVTR